MNTKPINTKLSHKTDKSFVITSTIPKNEIESAYKQLLSIFATKLKLDGFRPGKVPTDIAKQYINDEELNKELISKLLSETYSLIVEEEKLKPLVSPDAKILTQPIAYDKDWDVEFTSCQEPEIKLDPKFYDEVKKIDKQNEKVIDLIIETLIKFGEVTVPQILIDRDAEYYLSQHPETKKEDITAKIEHDWKTNFLIDFIGKEQKITVTPEEIQAIVSKNPSLGQNMNTLYYLIFQQKVIDYLKNLI